MTTSSTPEETERLQRIGRLLAQVSDKWTILIIRGLRDEPRRFNALRREVGGISQKVLASTLRTLEEYGFVSRTVTPVAPPRVEYALTDFGREFLVPVWGLAEWVLINSARMDAAREAFARRRACEEQGDTYIAPPRKT